MVSVEQEVSLFKVEEESAREKEGTYVPPFKDNKHC
jgi:hypothetical protein